MKEGFLHRHHSGPEGPPKAWIDGIDPRFRLVSMVAWIALAAWMDDPVLLSALFVLFAAAAVFLGTGAGVLLFRLGALTLALVPGWLLLPLFGPAEDVLWQGPVSIHSSGLLSASLLQLRASAILAALIAHSGTTSWHRWVQAAQRLKAPESLLSVFAFTLRYLPLLAGESRRTMTAAKARGFAPRARLSDYRGLAAIAGWGLVRSYYRSERVVRGMASRGFDGRFYLVDPEPTAASGFGFAFLSFCLFALFLWIRFGSGISGLPSIFLVRF